MLLVGNYHGDAFLDGGAGIDVADYTSKSSSVSVDLALHLAISAYSSWYYYDTIYNVENVNGSGYHDMLSGDDGANVLRGLDGNDWLFGHGARTRSTAETATTSSSVGPAATR
jgi:Ca2+-binding RTX toxin-like protein